jgi:hypothetical protein
VIAVIKCQKIGLAADLYDAAEKQSAGGDHRLLSYCTGTNGGMKRSLQKIIDGIWASEADSMSKKEAAASTSASSTDEARQSVSHHDPLDAYRLQELKKRARQTPEGVKDSRQVQRKRTSRKRIKQEDNLREVEVRNQRNQKMARVQDAVLFDSYDRRAEIIFTPRDGLWRLRDYYELLVACRAHQALARISPIQSAEGGFTIPRSETGWHQMLRAGVAPIRLPFAELSCEVLASVSAELRFGLGCGSLRWEASESSVAEKASIPCTDLWIDLMPEDPSFDKDSMNLVVPEERLVRLWAHRYVEDRQLMTFVKALEACGHRVQQTIGFRISRNMSTDSLFCVTGSRAASSRHKAAATGAVPFAIGASTGTAHWKSPTPRFNLLGSADTSADCPMPPRPGTAGRKRLSSLISRTQHALLDAAGPLALTDKNTTGTSEPSSSSSDAQTGTVDDTSSLTQGSSVASPKRKRTASVAKATIQGTALKSCPR